MYGVLKRFFTNDCCQTEIKYNNIIELNGSYWKSLYLKQ